MFKYKAAMLLDFFISSVKEGKGEKPLLLINFMQYPSV